MILIKLKIIVEVNMKRKTLIGLISLALGFGLASCKVTTESPSIAKEISFSGENVKIGQSFKLLGTVKRQHPEISNEGSPEYPVYGTSIPNITDEKKDALLAESDYLIRMVIFI